jgi:hypothetical protein
LCEKAGVAIERNRVNDGRGRWAAPLLAVLLTASAPGFAQDKAPPPSDGIETIHSDAMRELETIISRSGWYLMGRTPQGYRIGAGTTPGMAGQAAVFIHACNSDALSGHGAIERSFPAAILAGKRVRVAGRFKKEHDPGFAELYVNALGGNGRILYSLHQPVTDADWQARAVVMDVPDSAAEIEIGVALWGIALNTVWLEGFSIEIVDKTVPADGREMRNGFQRDPAEAFSDCDGVHRYP